MKCPNCGRENPDGAKFCKGCGGSLQSNSSSVSMSESKSSNNTLIICATILLAIIVIAGAFVLLNNGSDDSSSSDEVIDDADTVSSFNASDDDSTNLDTVDTVETVDSSYEDDLPEGMDFNEASTYFPEASDTVLAHVFDEADEDGDGYLSDNEFSLFKKVRDHTKKYANNVQNEYSTVKPSSGDKTGYCADHGRVAVVEGSQCPYCMDLGYSDTRTKTSSW